MKDKKYWKSLEELNNNSQTDYTRDHSYVHKNELHDLFKEESLNSFSSRRDFLKLFGYSIAASALVAGCEQPVHKAIPYLFKPEEVIPGKANYYASTFFDGDDYASILVKVRDGRPIKIEGNELWERGTSARTQASVLDLYDTARSAYPARNGNRIGWEEADKNIMNLLEEAAASDGKTVLLTGTVISPSTREIIMQFLAMHPRSEWIRYDPLSFSAMLEANSILFNRRVIPSMHFDRAEMIVSFGADFLGTWLMPAHFASQYADGRRITEDNARMLRHIQFESTLTVTGANADERIMIRPSRLQDILLYLLDKLHGNDPSPVAGYGNTLDKIAGELQENAGNSLVICGYNDVYAQMLVCGINHVLGNYGSTLDLNRQVNLRQGDDAAIENLIGDMYGGNVSAIIIHNVNPVFDHPRGDDFAGGLDLVGLKVSLAGSEDETAVLCDYICPDSHYLESWGDAEPFSGFYSLQQPVIRPLGDTRQMQDTLLVWSGRQAGYHAYLKEYWEKMIFPVSNQTVSFDSFWTGTLQKGVIELSYTPSAQPSLVQGALTKPVSSTGPADQKEGEFELEIYQSIAIGSGKHANNPWLQELPDPISKLCWDNHLAVSPSDAESLSLSTGDVVIIGGHISIPVLVQPGQAPGTVSAAMGYGRRVAGRVALGTGVNVLPLAGITGGSISYSPVLSSVEKTREERKLAITQTHHSMEGRAIVRETTLPEYRLNPSAGNEMRQGILDHMYTLYDHVKPEGLHWAMSIDLNACTGCSSCVIACQAENNIPVIGREEVRRRRIMHWIRIDRYYSGSADNPSVHFMPLPCQHCDHAPCENVCPVAATTQSDEGINQMAYVRCVGTKYCINNCPYKVRRFNWFNYTRSENFDYHMNSETGRLVLNPDVTVRERGIVEKCSFCIQRIQEAKITAKRENRILRDDEVIPACAQACPSKAIVFGNISNSDSTVSGLNRQKRNDHLLEELYTLPAVGYLTKIRNKQS
jgi:MoCo/4Fe-4S cofactor protein with predicted Tat translocation signal